MQLLHATIACNYCMHVHCNIAGFHEAKVLQPITAFRTVTWWWRRCWPVWLFTGFRYYIIL